jgi:protein PhnA
LSTTNPPCPVCRSEFTYEDRTLWVCPECAHEFSKESAAGSPSGDPSETPNSSDEKKIIRDSVGQPLQDGDTVTVIKDLKVKGSSTVIKVGTKVRNIKIVDGDHDIDCKIDGFGAMGLKSEFVKKVI